MMVTEPGYIQKAPGELELVRSFVNTRDIESGTDDLDSPAALLRWLRETGLVRPEPDDTVTGTAGAAVTPADLRRAVALREALRALLRPHSPPPGQRGAAAPGAGPAELRAIAATIPVRIDVRDDGQIALAPAGSGVASALARILLIAADAASTGIWPRLKACTASDCQWAFYDRSPARSGCWCSMRVCGSRAKSRAYRRRAAKPAVR